VFPPNPCRGHFLWDGSALWIWDGVAWDRIGPAAPGTAGIPEAPIDGNLYGRENAGWVIVPPPPVPSTAARVLIQFYSTSGNILIPPSVTAGLVSMWGATGGSGGASSDSQSGGSGAGGYLEKYLTGLVPGNTLSFVAGTAGIAGPAGGVGGNATTTTLTSGSQGIGSLTCNGSNGSNGSASPPGYSDGSPGGTATGGDVNITGQSGNGGAGVSQGSGGSTFYSIGADGSSAGTGQSIPGKPGVNGGLRIMWILSG
jgi:hypothetical protein